MEYQSYRNLEIYQLAVEIHYMTLTSLAKLELYEEGNQIRQSSQSIITNIFEGFGRERYRNEVFQYFTYALSSCDETRGHLDILFKINSLNDKDYHTYLVKKYEKLART